MTAAMFDRVLSTAAIAEVFSDAALVQGMLDFEAALARAQTAEGVIPGAAAAPIVAACRVEHSDLPALIAAGAVPGTVATPLVKQLTAQVAIDDAAAAGRVHWAAPAGT